VFVVGAESEWLWTGIQGGNRTVTTFGGGFTQTQDLSSKVDWLSLNSVRIGFVAADRWMIYGKGGNYLNFGPQDAMTTGVQTVNIPPTVGSISNLQRVSNIREENAPGEARHQLSLQRNSCRTQRVVLTIASGTKLKFVRVSLGKA
jgi:hypothetical protein